VAPPALEKIGAKLTNTTKQADYSAVSGGPFKAENYRY
jgi:hypothetical protein